MRQQLENIEGIYQPIQMQRAISDRQRVYTIGDLESLSATVLYSQEKRDSYIKANDGDLHLYNFQTLKRFGETEILNGEDNHNKVKKAMTGGFGISVSAPTLRDGS